MDPITAAILIGVLSTGVAVYQNNKAIKAQNQLRKQQESMRVDSVRNEVGATAQLQNIAVGASNKKNTPSLSPSFASAALTANQPTFNTQGGGSGSTGSGSAGTF